MTVLVKMVAVCGCGARQEFEAELIGSFSSGHVDVGPRSYELPDGWVHSFWGTRCPECVEKDRR